MDVHERAVAMAAAVAAGVGAVIAAAVRVWRKPSSQAEMITASQAALGDAIARLQSEVKRLQDRVDGLEAENADCRGENRQLWQWAESLEEMLRRSGIPIPARDMPRSFIVMEAERVTVMKPDRAAQVGDDGEH